MQEEFLALVREERERGCAVFLSSHELDEVERVCDRVGIIRDGRLIAVERVADLLGKTPRRVSVEFAEPVDLAELRALPGRERPGGRRRRASPSRSPETSTRWSRRSPATPSPISSSPTRPWRRSSSPTTRSGTGLTALIAAQLHDRRRSLLSWGLPLGLWSAFIVSIFPSIEASLAKAVRNYPQALKEAFGIGELSTVEQYLHAEMLSLIVPLAVGYLAVRSVASGLSGAAESGRLDVLLSAPVSRRRLVAAGFAATAIELAAVLAVTAGPHRDRQPAVGRRPRRSGPALAGFANVWPLALLFAGLGIVVTGWSLRTSVVTGSVAGRAGGDVRARPGRPARPEPRRDPLRLGLPLLRQGDRERHRPALLPRRHRRGRRARRARGLLFERRDLSP